MMKRLLSYFGILCFFVLLGWGGYYYWQGTPRYSLYQMGNAIKDKDSETFLLYLDIDGIVDGLAGSTSAAVEKKTSPAPPSKEPTRNKKSSANRRDLFKTLMPQVMKALRPILERQLIKIVEDIEEEHIISPLALCSLAHVRRKGQLAEVSIEAEGEKTYTFTMARASRRVWKIVRINMDFLDLLQKPRQDEK
jgi:hypothetical protein